MNKNKTMLQINEQGNLIEYCSDIKDHWQTYEETKLRQKGDCEDISLYKRQLAVNHGIDSKDLFIVYCYAGKQPHMVLWWEGKIYDNINQNVVYDINCEYLPVFGFNYKNKYIVKSCNDEWVFIERYFKYKKIDEFLNRCVK